MLYSIVKRKRQNGLLLKPVENVIMRPARLPVKIRVFFNINLWFVFFSRLKQLFLKYLYYEYLILLAVSIHLKIYVLIAVPCFLSLSLWIFVIFIVMLTRTGCLDYGTPCPLDLLPLGHHGTFVSGLSVLVLCLP